MRDRGEPAPTTRTVLAGPALATAVGLTGALLVALPAGASGQALGQAGPLRWTPAPVASLHSGLAADAVRPTVTSTAIPAAADSTTTFQAPRIAASVQAKHEGLAAHLRTEDIAPFALLGVTWRSSGRDDVHVLVRTRDADGWAPWTEAHVDADHGPTSHGAAAAERDPAIRSGTEPIWVGHATGVEVAVYTDTVPADLELDTIDPGKSQSTAAEQVETARAKSMANRAVSGTFPRMPAVITRRQWGADPRLGDRCWPPLYGRTHRAVFVHHTVNSNDYTRAQSAGIVRGIYAYHTQSRGWCDIGYNFLVDRFGQIYEGRRGGMRKPVRGAHAGDYNTNSTGISLIGNFEATKPKRKMKRALVKLIAWRNGTTYLGAYGPARIHDKTFRRISGHRDAMSTACPGQRVYDWLPRLRERVDARLGDYQSRIETAWRSRDGHRGWLGSVFVGEQRAAGGRFTIFTNGRAFASKETGVRMLREGAILREFLRAGGVAGPYGFPVTRLLMTGHREGTVMTFEGGRIWWSAPTGSVALHRGAILAKYRRMHAANGSLGFPVRAHYKSRDGMRVRFEHGYITWDSSKRKPVVTLL
jgi:hypothetical protein